MASFIKSDLEFILQQILVAEQHAAGANLLDILPNTEVAFGLRTVDGSFNNLIDGRTEFGAADNVFPRMTTPVFRSAETFDPDGPGGAPATPTSYAQTSGIVADSQVRTISNLIVDQTDANPAATAAAAETFGSQTVVSPGLDGLFGTGDDTLVNFIPNTSPDEGLSASFNSWMTFFGQFFDHGLDLVTKGGSGTVFIPLKSDDPLFVPGSPTNFMVLTRATNQPGPDGILGTADDVREHTNTTSPFVDQNQTYSSHPSHQVFLREYASSAGKPVATGRLIVNRDLGADGRYGTADDTVIGGMATWKVVKAQARDLLGINLTDADVNNLPLLATDQYGNFLRGPNGFVQVVMKGVDGLPGTADDVLVEGNPLAPLNLANAVRTGHAFLDDIAHAAAPRASNGTLLTADADTAVGNTPAAGQYDNELLDAHYIAGDGRVNENIGLTTVHHVFHSEHNRLVQHTKDTVLSTNDLAFLNKWLMPGTELAVFPATQPQIDALQWNGERLFQAAKFGTEMQYQHLVFEEFARTIQPQVDLFIDYDVTVDPSIVAEFAHTVYRFGHSMLTETIDRLDPQFNNDEIGLIRAFLNPLEFAASGPTPEEAAGAIVRGVTRQVGNEIDEFVTEALRNNLVGLPLDLAAINLARGRDAGIPSLNAARREFYAGTGDSQLKPYTSWADFVQHLKHPESLVNFIAAYGTHGTITGATTMAAKRAAADALVFGGAGAPADRLAFLNSTGTWASAANGVTTTGLDNVDFWIGGLAEQKMPFGGMLGSTFNFVFETQLEALQNGDRFYYLHRTAGLNFLSELENNSFAKLVMLNTDATHLPALMFSTPGLVLEVDPTRQFNPAVVAGLDGIEGTADDLPASADPAGESTLLTPLVSRDNPATPGPDTNYVRYTGPEHIVMGGTAGDDILISSEGDDTLYGDAGNDRLEGGYGNDDLQGGDGDDIISDAGGDDVLKGDAGNDVIHGGQGVNLIISGPGKDFVITGEDFSEVFAGPGDDFILGAKTNLQTMGAEGNDWIEIGTQDGAPGDNFDPLGLDQVEGHDVFIGGGGFDEMIGEGGDDIMVGSEGPDKLKGMSGYDWATFKNEQRGVSADFFRNAFVDAVEPLGTAAVSGRFAQVEGLSGSSHNDILRGDDTDALTLPAAGAKGSVLTNVALIDGLQAFLGAGVTSFAGGNIILGGAGSDIMEGRGGDDLIDGDRWLNVRISVRDPNDHNVEIRSVDSMQALLTDMMSGAVNPGQLEIVREMLTAPGGFDTAVYSDIRANYNVTVNAGVVTVVHNTGVDGSDRLTNVERLQFADQKIILAPGINAEPVGQVRILNAPNNAPDSTPIVGQTLRASVALVTDADNPGGTIGSDVVYFWQQETVPGSGLFVDISGPLGGGSPSAVGPTFTVTGDLQGIALRVKAHYTDADGVFETVFSAPTSAVGPGTVDAPLPLLTAEQTGVVSPGVHYIGSDLQFILDQIRIAERHAAGEALTDILPNSRVPYGLRTVDGSFNNLVQGQTEHGASDNVFPRMTTPEFRDAEAFDPDGPGPAPATPTSYTQTSGIVADSQPRTISNLIVDQTDNNPAATAAAAATDGSQVVVSPGLDGNFGTADDTLVNFIPNAAPDVALSAPFNAWMTFFGQFFDHGLDLVNKGGSGTVFIPLKPDDPLFNPASPTNFMVLTRATNLPGPDGVLGTADDIHEHTNQTSPFVDQNQTYSSHPSHQVFLREYAPNPAGRPVDTGRLIVNRDLGADGRFGTADDTVIGGMATWKVVKAQARDVLGINLTDADVNNLPLLATDAYGNFLRGSNGYVQVVMRGPDGQPGTADDVLVEGNPNAPISLANAVRTGHAFLDDIAHFAAPRSSNGTLLTADADTAVGNTPAAGQYDNELLDAHYIAGDGRVNENIGLTTVHHVFHAEHNRLVEHTKDVVLGTNNLEFLGEWLAPGTAPASFPVTQAQIDALQWNGARLFQAAKFGTEMQYQHLVFEEFARTIQPQIDIFVGPTQVYDTAIDPSIVAEFAHTVYRFGHSMLTETIDRFDANYNSNEIGLIKAFLNPLEFAASGPTPEAAAGAIVRGLTRQVGNEIDEFVTEALRNNLVGLPLDLAALNLARGRDAGVPSLNAARREFYEMTGDGQLKPYASWADFVQYIKHPESLVNFIAAYGTHSSITAATAMADKRAAANLLVFGDGGVTEPADRLDFLNSTGAWASGPNGVTTTGLDDVDFWIGGLAEEIMPFGGMLGSSFNFVFETQLEKLQDGDRFYYLDRNAGLNFVTELENNSFAKMIMNATDATHLPALVFKTGLVLEVDQSHQFNAGLGSADPTGTSPLTPLVIRNNPATVGPDGNYLKYTGDQHAVLGGTAGNDIMAASIGDDSLWGDGGNDRMEGGAGNDSIRGGAGDDIITDDGGDDNIQGDDGNDVIHGGNGVNLILGGFGSDFIITGEDASEAFGGPGNDFMLGSNANEQDMGNEGDDWIEEGNLDGNPGDNFDPFGRDLVIGNDVYLGSGGPDIMNSEGGDDIMVGSSGPGDKYIGASGYDWATFKDDAVGVDIDLTIRALDAAPAPVAGAILARFSAVEGLSGSRHSDILHGDDEDAATLPNAGMQGSVLTNVGLIDGLQAVLGAGVTSFGAGNIILGGDGSDLIEGRGGNDLIDGDKWLNVRISVRSATNPNVEIASFDSMKPLVPLMLAGTYSPGQLRIVREILTAPGPDFDTAVFRDVRLNYDITQNANGTWTVAHTLGTLIDGTDTLRNIERLQFADQSMVLVPGLNAEPVGLATVSDPTPEVGNAITASIAGVTDGDNTASGGAITGTVAYTWQVDLAGDGIFTDIQIVTGVGVERVTGPTMTVTPDLAGLALRVQATYIDQHGVIETVFSAPTAPVSAVQLNDAPVGTVTVSDVTPQEGTAVSATFAITDVDGTTTSVFSTRWQAGNGVTFADIAGANAATFTPTQAQVGLQLRAVVSYTDDGGTLEQLFSAPTIVVGDVAVGTNAAETLTGTDGEDNLQGRGGDDTLIGLASNDVLAGEGGNDFIDGGSGADTMAGGPGSDTYLVDDALDSVTEAAGAGTDEVQTTLNAYTLGANLENLTYTGTGSFTGTGNALANVIRGGSNADTMAGLAGNDTYFVDHAADLVIEAAGQGTDTVQTTLTTITLADNVENLTFVGAGGFDATGNALANVIRGGTGADTMAGLAGNDTYFVDHASDAVIEQSGQGTDTVQTTLGSYTLTANVENLGFVGTGAFSGTGNTLNNTIMGGASNDTLSGGGGNDLLIGNAGADTMIGGAGNDTYVVDNTGDLTVEAAGQGSDTVQARVNAYTLGANVESLIFIGTGNFNGTGNALANTLIGGSGNDTLNGGIGADSLIGGAGNDTYVVDNTADVVTELAGAGTDTVQSTAAAYTLSANVENLTYTGAGNFNGTGNNINNTLRGGAGNDRLTGAAGNDVLIGNGGDDTFVFASGFGSDRIQGFDADPAGGQDLLDISALGVTAASFNAQVNITDVGADTLVGVGGGFILLLGVANAATVTAADFVLA